MFTFEQLKIFLMENNEIECRQQIDGQNINDQQLPYETVAVPKMPKNQFFKEGNISLSINIIVTLKCLHIRMDLLNLTICCLVHVSNMSTIRKFT